MEEFQWPNNQSYPKPMTAFVLGSLNCSKRRGSFIKRNSYSNPLFPARPNHPDRSEPEKQGRGNVVAHHDDKNARKVLGTRSQVGSSISGPLLRQLPTAGSAGFITILSAS